MDHPDGLRDPLGYFQRLRAEAPSAWILAEKVLEPGEELPEDWPVAGTTGYEFLNRVLGLLLDSEGETPLTGTYRSFSGEEASWPEVAHDSRLLIMDEVLGSDLARLAALFERVCEGDRRHRDYTHRELLDCLREVDEAERTLTMTRGGVQVHCDFQGGKVSGFEARLVRAGARAAPLPARAPLLADQAAPPAGGDGAGGRRA